MLKKTLKYIIILLLIFLILIIQSEEIELFFDKNLFYTKRYEKIVEEQAKNFGVDENLIYAIIQNESNFFPFAKSKSDARGLMQITPITWDHAQNVLGFEQNDYYDKNANIMAGTWYLSYLDQIYQDERFVIMAYNAGMENINIWRERGFLEGDDISKWNIPFLETRIYLDRVIKSKEKFENIERMEAMEEK